MTNRTDRSRDREFPCGFAILSSVALALVAVFAGSVFAPRAAHAQNLVQNPVFVDGTNGYSVTGMITVMPTQNPNFYLAKLFPGALITQTVNTNPDTLYTVSFFAAFTPTNNLLNIYFGNGGSLQLSSAAGSTNGIYSFSALSSGDSSVLGFSEGGGVNLISALDVEAAPTPLPGSGALSFVGGLAGFAAFGIRRRRS